MKLSALTTQLLNGQDLAYADMCEVMQAIMSGQVEDIPMSGFLTALAGKGETTEELLAGAEIMQALSTTVSTHCADELVDPVGTGGSHSGVFNVSTASSIVAACGGVKIAKHGGRAASSKSGSADLLEAAGINLDLSPKQLSQCIDTFGMGFLFAPNMHAAMRHVASVRKALGVRTIFNLLGPLTNPADAKRQVLGVFDKRWLQPMARVSQRLGKRHVMVVHSRDGLDEISIAAPTDAVELRDNQLSEYSLNPQNYGMFHDNLDAVRVSSTHESLDLIHAAFNGQRGAAYDMIVLNSAAILQVSDRVDSYEAGIEQARHILDSGQAGQKLTDFARFTQAFTTERE